MPFIAALGAFLSRLIFSRLGAWLVSAAVFAGLELASYKLAVQPIRDTVLSAVGGIPAELTQWMGVLRIDQYITIILSAYVAATVKKTIVRRRAAA